MAGKSVPGAGRPKLRLLPGGGQPAKELHASGAEEDDLLRAVLRGERNATTAFVARIRPAIDRTLSRLVGPRDRDREDIAQLAVIELLHTLDRYRGLCSLDYWTSTLTAHIAHKHLRRRDMEGRIFYVCMLEETAIASPDHPGREAMARSALIRLVDHMKESDFERTWTVVLHDVFGYDLREIALITGATESAAQSRLVRGRRALRRWIREDPELADFFEDIDMLR